jgi:hypothetical protein
MSKIKSDAHLYLSDVGDPTPSGVAVTGITIVDPVTVTTTIAAGALVDGDFVVLNDTGSAYLDGNAFRVSNVTATTFQLADAHGPSIGAVAPSSGTYIPYTIDSSSTVGLLTACMATITLTGQAPDSIVMDDMCSNTTELGSAKPPTFTFQGWSDQDSEGYRNLWRASVTDPKPVVQCLIDYGPKGGYVFGPAQIGEITITAANAQGLQFSGAGVFTEVPTYSWAL